MEDLISLVSRYLRTLAVSQAQSQVSPSNVASAKNTAASFPQRCAVIELSQQLDNCRSKIRSKMSKLELLVPSLTTGNNVSGPEAELLEAFNGFGRLVEKLDFLANALPVLYLLNS